MVALMVLYVPICPAPLACSGRGRNASRTVSISMTVLKPFSESPSMGTRKLPAAPVCAEGCYDGASLRDSVVKHSPQMTKSILPNFSIVFATAFLSCSGSRTSACAARHCLPVALDNSAALAFSRSSLHSWRSALWHRLPTRTIYSLSAHNGRVRSVTNLRLLQL